MVNVLLRLPVSKQVTRQGKKQGYHNCCATKTANQLRQKECSHNANFVRQVASGKAIYGKEKGQQRWNLWNLSFMPVYAYLCYGGCTCLQR
jgi:hypothetical protein